MIYGLYHSAAGMLTNEYRQAVLANNIANADTVGFKRDVVAFAERVPATSAGVRSGASADNLAGLSGGLWLGQTFTDFTETPKTYTANWSDVALEGPGFLVVSVNGEALLTRDGRLRMNADGQLVAAADGAHVLGRGGGPIQLNPRGGEPRIDEEGRIIQDGTIVAELELVDYEDYAMLRKAGATRFLAPADGAYRASALVQSGYTEASGAQPIRELVDLMAASQAYQLNARMVALQDESLGRLINTVLQA